MIRKKLFQKKAAVIFMFLLLIPIQAPAFSYVEEQNSNSNSFMEEWNSDRFELKLKRRICLAYYGRIIIECKSLDEPNHQKLQEPVNFSFEFYYKNLIQKLFSWWNWNVVSYCTIEPPPIGEKVDLIGPSGMGYAITSIKAEVYNDNGNATYLLSPILIIGAYFIAMNLDFVAVDTNETR